MPSGAKRPGSPLEGKTTKFLIAEQVDGQAPSQRVAHPRKLTKVSTSGAKAADSITIQFANISLKEGPPNANAPDFLRGVDTSVKGAVFCPDNHPSVPNGEPSSCGRSDSRSVSRNIGELGEE